MTHAQYLLLAADAIFRILLAFLCLFRSRAGWIVRPTGPMASWSASGGISVSESSPCPLGQILNLLAVYSLPTLLLRSDVAVLVSRSIRRACPSEAGSRGYTELIVTVFNILDHRINVPRRIRRRFAPFVAQDQKSLRRQGQTGGGPCAGVFLLVAADSASTGLFGLDLGLERCLRHLYCSSCSRPDTRSTHGGPDRSGIHFVLLAFRALTKLE